MAPSLTLVPLASKSSAPLIVESHPPEYSGLPFITLIQYKKQTMLTIVDNVTDSDIRAYVLDLCGPEHVAEEELIALANAWYENGRILRPFSVELSKAGLTAAVSRVYRVFNIEFISRVIGPAPVYATKSSGQVKRKKCRQVPAASLPPSVVQQLF